jgi:hypothetical protein
VLVLHVGLHKCGSSSIQYFMSCNAAKLRELGILYPKVGRNHHAHHPLANQLRNDVFEDIDSLTAMAAEHTGNDIVISSEDLSLLRNSQVLELRRRFGDQDILVVFYVRELSGLAPSKYNEHTRKGMNLINFDEFWSKHNLSNGLKLSYRAVQWAESFGWANIRVRSLDRRSLVGGNLMDDFLSIFDLSLADFGGTDAPGLEPQNVSNGWKVLEVLRAQFGQLALNPTNFEIRRNRPYIRRKTATQLRNTVVGIMSELNLAATRTQYISAQQWKQCNEAYAREVETLNKKLIGPDIPLPEPQIVTERPFLPTIGEIAPEELREIAERLHSGLGSHALTGDIIAQARLAL